MLFGNCYYEIMPQRKIILTSGEIYHVFNRGVNRMPIFSTPNDFMRFIDLIMYYRYANTPVSFSNFKKREIEQKEQIMQMLEKGNDLCVEILAFCLMDNHYHFLLKQITEQGVSSFVSNMQNGYAKFYNMKNNRSGPFFQPMFKVVRIETDEQMLHVSRYIHLNPVTNYVVSVRNLSKYPWFSFGCYTDDLSGFEFVRTSRILDMAGGKEKYKNFVYDQIDYQREISKIRHLTLDQK